MCLWLTGLMLTQVMLDMRSYRWIPHYQGLGALLATKGHEENGDDMYRSLYYSVLSHDVGSMHSQ
jgi:hypothetical protein